MGQKKVTYRAKKRKYGGNQHSHHTPPVQEACNDNLPTTPESASGTTLQCPEKKYLHSPSLDTSHFILIDYEILQNIVNIVGQCPECQYTPLHMENLL